MSVTYDGSSITTDPLYMDGTIQVKKGFPRQDTEYKTSFQLNIISSRKKESMRIMSLPTENSSVNAVNVLTSRHSIKIKTNNIETEDSNFDSVTVLSARRKDSIVIP